MLWGVMDYVFGFNSVQPIFAIIYVLFKFSRSLVRVIIFISMYETMRVFLRNTLWTLYYHEYAVKHSEYVVENLGAKFVLKKRLRMFWDDKFKVTVHPKKNLYYSFESNEILHT